MDDSIESDGTLLTHVDVFSNWVNLQPNKTAFHFLRDNGVRDSVTYAELDAWARAIAANLLERGFAGSRAILIYPPGLDFVAAFVGCMYAGVIAVPVNPPRPNKQSLKLQAIIDDSSPSLVLSTANLIDSYTKKNNGNFCEKLTWICTESFRDSTLDRQAFLRNKPDSLALLQYTSGSTMSPRGVMVTHKNLYENSTLIQQAFGTTMHSVAVSWLPHFHDMGLIGGILGTLFCGGSSTLISPAAFIKRPLIWLETISSTKATVSGGPDFGYAMCVEKITDQQKENLDLSSWNLAFSGAEPVRQETIEQFTQTFLQNGFRFETFTPCYGLAEATLLVSSNRAKESPSFLSVERASLEKNHVVTGSVNGKNSQKIVGCGKSASGLIVKIVDPESHHETSSGEVGEIWVSGPSVAKGYWNNDKATEEHFNARIQSEHSCAKYLRTGDLGFLHNDVVYITGRRKDLIIIRGRNIYPQDVEWAIKKSSRVISNSTVAVFSVDIDEQEELVVAVEMPVKSKTIEIDTLLEKIRQCVAADHDIEPYSILLVKKGRIFRTSSGKVQRHACRKAFIENTWEKVINQWVRSASHSNIEVSKRPNKKLNSHDIQEVIIQTIANLLSVQMSTIDIHAPFANLGLSSLQGVQLIEQLEAYLGHEISQTLFYNYPTIYDLSNHLSGKGNDKVLDISEKDIMDSKIWSEIEQLSDDKLVDFIETQMAENT
jgi:acyl-CoA synthetase (AMP-forming)/AMP-acid ligase II/acyl carrier protein